MSLVTGRRSAATSAAALLALGCLSAAHAASPDSGTKATDAKAASADAGTLRVCAAQQPPLSLKDGSGLENRIAVAVAQAMGRKAQFVWLDKAAIYLVRDSLDKNLCDVVVGVDSDDQRVLTTKPYYRSGYVFITRADKDLDVKSWSDPRLKTIGHMVVGFGTPAEAMLKDIGRYEEDMAYLYSLVNFRAPRNQYTQIDPARMVTEVATDKADVAVAFGPDVARYVKDSSQPLRMTLVPNDTVRSDGQRMPQSFDQSMGVRRGDEALRRELDAAIVKAKPQIDALLKQEGVPLAPPSN
ncbi:MULTISPECIES: methanol oxidation system protein MoxJ [unclassified Methylobacterium]|uniref:methanol oxidation system protein MoxJ n=1 Tax=unclassified Methylobacterium TaxID=2615210 RepID=UPI0006FF4EC1|nr:MULTISPECIES: methanol oxidation system protein MoxJ [unclassified Methylobacterium]KQP56345.1 methanol oxidation system protein MoxJ [Methylobacterium sp. Leaf108]KQT90265.1 methanol oxidation system protein MoxJ [Methylobacterium sp. Leaf466]